MKFKAVLGIKSLNSKEIKKYRIMSDTNETRDIPVDKIKEALNRDINTIEGLSLLDNKLIETIEIPQIPELGFNKISLLDWCKMNNERGQRILNEFNGGNNFPITAKDISVHSALKAQFRCNKCGNINNQIIANKTRKNTIGCKYCAGQENRGKNITLLDWCNNHGQYGAQILQEFIAGDNNFSPDQISYASRKYVKFKCNKCGKINNQIILSKTRKNPRGCKYCNTSTTSFGEQLIFLWLQSQGFEVYNRYSINTYLGNKEFDIFLPTLNLAIEHQSSMHANINKNFCDDKTELLAQSLGIKLLEICLIDNRYNRQENSWCLTYKMRHEQEMINKLSNWINTNYGLNTNPTYPRSLEDQAYLNSCKVKYENSLAYHNPPFLKEWNYQLNGIVTPDKVSLNSPRKYYWTCSTCGHIYLSAPNWRNKGHACPNWRNHNKY